MALLINGLNLESAAAELALDWDLDQARAEAALVTLIVDLVDEINDDPAAVLCAHRRMLAERFERAYTHTQAAIPVAWPVPLTLTV